MSETASNLHVLYRLTVPGVVFTSWIYLILPYSFVRKLLLSVDGAALTITFLLGATVVIGWISYHTIYPVWKKFLIFPPIAKLHLYPRSQILLDIKRLTNHAEVEVKPEHLWSYFLWTHCHEAIRQRVKSLADYGHSLYLVSCAFIVLPLLFALTRVMGISQTTLLRLLSIIVGDNSQLVLVLEVTLTLLAVVTGVYILRKGQERIQYAEQIQWLLYQEQREKVKNILDKIKSDTNNHQERKPG